jgi:hypothetical protein
MRNELPLLLGRIRDLLEDTQGPASDALLAEIEHTLTDGYARALTIEGERIRVERRISELARELTDLAQAQELGELAERLKQTDAELDGLRGLLGALSDRADAVRAAA